MNDEDKKYLRFERKARPSFEVFSRMVQILKSVHAKTDLLTNKVYDSLLKTSKDI